jgi:hypothetical protein
MIGAATDLQASTTEVSADSLRRLAAAQAADNRLTTQTDGAQALAPSLDISLARAHILTWLGRAMRRGPNICVTARDPNI